MNRRIVVPLAAVLMDAYMERSHITSQGLEAGCKSIRWHRKRWWFKKETQILFIELEKVLAVLSTLLVAPSCSGAISRCHEVCDL